MNPNIKAYKYYGAKGIKICDEWQNSFEVFYEDMVTDYKDGLTIDRINVYGNYCKENCRWVTMKEQNNNKTDNTYITINNITHTLSEWSDISGLNRSTLKNRLYNASHDTEKLSTIIDQTKPVSIEINSLRKTTNELKSDK